jgi:hypothetical protein
MDATTGLGVIVPAAGGGISLEMGGMLLLSASPSRGEVGSRALGEVTGVRPEEEYLRLCEDDEAVRLSSCQVAKGCSAIP